MPFLDKPVRGVGLFIYTLISGTLYAVCSVCGPNESWSGLLQPTCFGRLLEGEEYADALQRVSAEFRARTMYEWRIQILGIGNTVIYGCKLDSVEFVEGDFRRISYQEISRVKIAQDCHCVGVPSTENVMAKGHIDALITGFKVFNP